jgi:hypothetical protein
MELWIPTDVKDIGVTKWSLAWLAFKELGQVKRSSIATCNRMYPKLRALGWFEGLGLFSGLDKRIQERVQSNPYSLWVAYESAGDICVGDACPVSPDRLVPWLAETKNSPEPSLFPPSQVSEAILLFNLEQGTEALRLASQNPRLPVIARSRLLLAAEMGSSIAQLFVARMYSEGRCVPQDHLLAHKFANLAVANPEVAREATAIRDRASRELTVAARNQAEADARSWQGTTWDLLVAANPAVDSLNQ